MVDRSSPGQHRVNIALAWNIGQQFMWHGANRFAKFVTWVSLFGLVIGVTILTVVVTVMNGFDKELKARLLDSIPHITLQNITPAEAKRVINQLDTQQQVAVTSLYFRGFGALSSGGRVYPIGLYAVDVTQPQQLKRMRVSMAQGELSGIPANGIALSVPVARLLRLNLGDAVTLMSVSATESGDSDVARVAPKLYHFVLSATFQLAAESDYTLALLNLQRFPPAQWQTMGEYGVQVQLTEPLLAPGFAQRWHPALSRAVEQPDQLQVDSWASEYGELFRAVQLEKTMMFLILLLVVAIAAFNIIAGQTMVVNDKKADIGILRTMGASAGTILLTFLSQGVWVSVFGTVMGLLLGALAASYINEILSLVEAVTGMHLLDGSLFLSVPTDFQLTDLAIIAGMSIGLCLLSAYLPAKRAADLDPVANLH